MTMSRRARSTGNGSGAGAGTTGAEPDKAKKAARLASTAPPDAIQSVRTPSRLASTAPPDAIPSERAKPVTIPPPPMTAKAPPRPTPGLMALRADPAVSEQATQAKANITIKDATSDDDTVAETAKKKFKLSTGEVVDVNTASVSMKRALLKELRAADAKAKKRGRTTNSDERDIAKQLQARLRKAGLERAKVTAVATKPGQEADLRIECVPVGRIAKVCKAICGKPKRR